MAACNFSITFEGSAAAVYQKAKAAVEKQGGSFTGDESSGSFEVSVFGNTIAGSYAVNGQSMAIQIETKPFLIPCNAIESFLKNQIGV